MGFMTQVFYLLLQIASHIHTHTHMEVFYVITRTKNYGFPHTGVGVGVRVCQDMSEMLVIMSMNSDMSTTEVNNCSHGNVNFHKGGLT